MEIKIRRAGKKDIPDLVKLWQEMVNFHDKLPSSKLIDDFYKMKKNATEIQRAWFLKSLKSRGHTILIASLEGKPVGFLKAVLEKNPGVFCNKKKIYIGDLAVTEKYRNRGIGKMLLDDMARRAAKSGIKYLTLEVFPNNKEAVKFYKNNGFEDYHIILVKRV